MPCILIVCHKQPLITAHMMDTLHTVKCLFIEKKERVGVRRLPEIQYAVQLSCVIACKILISMQPLGKAREMV